MRAHLLCWNRCQNHFFLGCWLPGTVQVALRVRNPVLKKERVKSTNKLEKPPTNQSTKKTADTAGSCTLFQAGAPSLPLVHAQNLRISLARVCFHRYVAINKPLAVLHSAGNGIQGGNVDGLRGGFWWDLQTGCSLVPAGALSRSRAAWGERRLSCSSSAGAAVPPSLLLPCAVGRAALQGGAVFLQLPVPVPQERPGRPRLSVPVPCGPGRGTARPLCQPLARVSPASPLPCGARCGRSSLLPPRQHGPGRAPGGRELGRAGATLCRLRVGPGPSPGALCLITQKWLLFGNAEIHMKCCLHETEELIARCPFSSRTPLGFQSFGSCSCVKFSRNYHWDPG